MFVVTECSLTCRAAVLVLLPLNPLPLLRLQSCLRLRRVTSVQSFFIHSSGLRDKRI